MLFILTYHSIGLNVLNVVVTQTNAKEFPLVCVVFYGIPIWTAVVISNRCIDQRFIVPNLVKVQERVMIKCMGALLLF